MKNNILYDTDTKCSPIYWKSEYTAKYCPMKVRITMDLINKTNNSIKQIRIPFSGGKK